MREITDDHIALFTADMDFRCAPAILDALHATVDHGIFGYSTIDGCPAYADAVRDWFARRDQWTINTDLMLYCPGTVRALEYAVEAFTERVTALLSSAPSTLPLPTALRELGRNVLNNQLIRHADQDECGDFGYTMVFLTALLARRDDAKLMILCNPHNPVGRVWSVDESLSAWRISARATG